MATTASVIIGGVTYFSYEVLIDQNYYSEGHSTPYAHGAFQGAISLESVTLPDNTLFFNSEAFLECDNLKEIIVSENSLYFKTVDGILYNKALTRLVYYPQGIEDESFTIPISVDEIIGSAFTNASYLKSLTINSTIEELFTLNGIPNLEEILVDESNLKYFSVEGVLYHEDSLVRYPSSKVGTTYSVPNGITQIAPYAFQGNKFLEDIDLNETTHIYDHVFLGSKSLLVINFPDKLSFIGRNVLYESSVTTLLINDTCPTLGTMMLLGSFGEPDENELKIYVFDTCLESYLDANIWINYESNMFPLSTYVEE